MPELTAEDWRVAAVTARRCVERGRSPVRGERRTPEPWADPEVRRVFEEHHHLFALLWLLTPESDSHAATTPDGI